MRRDYPSRPIPAVGVVVWKDDTVLLVRRAKPPHEGEWSLPGGAQKVGETVADAACREVHEETGVAISLAGVVDVIDSLHHDDKGDVLYHYTLIDMAAHWTGGEPRAGGDAADVRWFPFDTLKGLGLWPETLRVIAKSRRAL